MSDTFDHEADAYDRDEDLDIADTKCRHCGRRDVEWVHQPGTMGGRGTWTLFDWDGLMHALSCPARPRTERQPDFDASITRVVAKINGSMPAQYQDGMRTTRPGWREPFPVKGSPPQKPPRATKKEKLMRTMYDNHQGANGSLPICMMDDDHLRNTIRLNATRFNDERAAGLGIQNGPATNDPMVKSLVRQRAWSEKEVEERTCNILRHIAPYILEACVRGETVAQEAVIAMRLIARRDQIVPGNPVQIAYEELP